MANEKNESVVPQIKVTKKRKPNVRIIKAGKEEARAPVEWKDSELDFRMAITKAMQRYETALVMSGEGYRKAQLNLESRYRKMRLGIISDLNELATMLSTIDLIKDDGQHKILYDTESGIGYKLIPRDCGYNPTGRSIEEKIVSKPE